MRRLAVCGKHWLLANGQIVKRPSAGSVRAERGGLPGQSKRRERRQGDGLRCSRQRDVAETESDLVT
ncbi:hypothetical protein ACIA8G_35080 [Lentzea sp. NPDC051213]|uniref:hypothetical protein n=1 Tax=Lentzea sp. NPDC051213 TaxID=3364126 RepID=UPI0037A2103C